MFRLSSRKALGQELKCNIKLLLPGEELEKRYNTNSTGQDLLNEIVNDLDLADKDYYGLKLHDQIQWLDLTKSIYKQTKGIGNVIFELRFKYYPAQPALLAHESTRYYLYLQLRLDLLEGRLRSENQDVIAYLIACILQSELGDFKVESKSDKENYVAEYKFVPNQTEDLEWAAIALHKNEDFQGLQPADSELNFLKKACQLDAYGIDPYPVKEGNSHNHFLIGVNYKGITTFQDSKKTNQFTWDEIERIALDNKLVLIYCLRVDKKGAKTIKSRPLFGFRCPSQEYAHHFWKIATEHKFFFTLDSSPDTPIVTNTGGLFKRTHKLKYTGRVEKDLLRDHVDENRSSGVKRSHSLMSKTSDGPRWQGFQTSNKLQSSLTNIYNSDALNKTMPSNLNCFREEEEDQIEDCNSLPQSPNSNARPSICVFSDSRKRSFTTDMDTKESPRPYMRRPTLTTKNETPSNAIRKDSQIYMDTNQKTHDFIKITLILIQLVILLLLITLLLSESSRPSSLSLIVKKLNLESTSISMRQNFYLPLKSAIEDFFSQIFSNLDSKIQ